MNAKLVVAGALIVAGLSAAGEARSRPRCAGEFAHGVAWLNNNIQGVVNPGFRNAQQLMAQARACWGANVTSVTYFDEGDRLVCAPYIRCYGLNRAHKPIVRRIGRH